LCRPQRAAYQELISTFSLTARIGGDSVRPMRMRRRFSESFKVLVVPVVCCAVTAYFGYSGIVGPRGIIAWNRTEAELAVKQRELAQVQSERKALEHRI